MTLEGFASARNEFEAGLGVYAPRGLTIVRGKGAHVQDEEGRSYLDLTSMYGVALLGHAHPELTGAIQEQATRLTACFGTFGNDRRAALASRLATWLAPQGLDRFFFANSGSEAVEAAIKIARHTTGRSGVLAATGGFHGRTLGALSATFRPAARRPFEPLLPDVSHAAYGDLSAFERALDDGVGAVLLEIIQGESGVHSAEAAFLTGVATLCRERGARLVLDEVQTGCGRTGTFLAAEAFGLEPDLVCLAKGIAGGLPLSVLAAGPRVPNLPPGLHGSTFGGNPVAAAAAVRTLEILAEPGFLNAVRRTGETALSRMRSIVSPRVRAVRGRGLMLAIELKERAAPHLRELQARGVLALPAGPTSIRLLPPLTIGEDELLAGIAVIEEILAS